MVPSVVEQFGSQQRLDDQQPYINDRVLCVVFAAVSREHQSESVFLGRQLRQQIVHFEVQLRRVSVGDVCQYWVVQSLV